MIKLAILCLAFGAVISMEVGGEKNLVRASKRFFISTESRSFVGAWVACKMSGMQLASIETSDEQVELNEALNSISYYPEGYWIGAVAENSVYDKWYWVDTGLRVGYTNWGSSQPHTGSGYVSDYCMKMGSFYKDNDNLKWANADCNWPLYYICELP